MRFYKYHGAGNDFVLLENLNGEIEEEAKAELARVLCDRHFGVGADGLLLVERSSRAEARFRYFNGDGSEAEMCGNGMRCFAKHLYDFGIVKREEMRIETLAGIINVKVFPHDGVVREVEVELGAPRLLRREIPALGEGRFLNQLLKVEDKELRVSAVNTGVPHAVVFVEDVESVDVHRLGRALRFHRLFPQGANVNFLQKLGENTFAVRTYERGVEGETLACGTGVAACAAVVVLLGEASPGKVVEIRARGGTLFVRAQMRNGEVVNLRMRGPAKRVFRGETEEIFEK
ncbi:diaminopimelate epimerase [Candidatus Pyrohabitans sp.]